MPRIGDAEQIRVVAMSWDSDERVAARVVTVTGHLSASVGRDAALWQELRRGVEMLEKDYQHALEARA